MKRIRIIAWTVCICLAFSTLSLGAAFAAEKAKAASFRLEKAEGIVEITGSNGKNISPSEGMLFYSGDVIHTSAKSYAYISLDDSKLLKIDELSQAVVKKSGKKLEIVLEEGALYFEVNEKLSDAETMTIGTSTISLSIRGTAGVVRKRNMTGSVQDTVWLLDGQIELEGKGNAAGRPPITVWGGERIDYVENSGQWKRDLIAIMDIPGFADVEMRKNSVLMQKILSDSGLDSEWIALNAEKKLQEDQADNRQQYGNVFEQKQIPTAPPSPVSATDPEPASESAPDESGDGDTEPSQTPEPRPSAKPEPDPTEAPNPTETPEIYYCMARFYGWDEELLSVQEIEKGEEPVVPDPPIHEGFQFVGWDPEVDKIYEDTDYHACFKEIESTPEPTPEEKYYVVHFYDWGLMDCLSDQLVKEGDFPVVPEAPVHEGYVFTGWEPEVSEIFENTDYVATFVEDTGSTPDPTKAPEEKYYKIYFYDSNSSYLDDQMVLEGQLPIPPEPPVHSGYRFVGWKPEISEAYEDVNYKAVYEKIS